MKCPLCQQELLEIEFGREVDYICRVRIKFEGEGLTLSASHYEQRFNSDICWYVPPYRIISRPGQTIVSKKIEYYRDAIVRPEFEHVFTVDEVIKPDEPEKLLKRIKLLTILS